MGMVNKEFYVNHVQIMILDVNLVLIIIRIVKLVLRNLGLIFLLGNARIVQKLIV